MVCRKKEGKRKNAVERREGGEKRRKNFGPSFFGGKKKRGVAGDPEREKEINN